MTKEEMKELIKLVRDEQAAKVLEASDLTPFQVQKFSLDLSTAQSEQNPFNIGFPFKTIWFKNASASGASVNIKLNKNETGISRITVKDNDILKSNSMFSKGFLDWSAQSGVTIDCYVFVDSEVYSGALINSGTVNIANPSSFTITNPVVSAATAYNVFSSNSSSKKRTIENASGADLWLGGSAVTNSGATRGLKIPSGNIYETTNTGSLYVYSVAGFAAGLMTAIEET